MNTSALSLEEGASPCCCLHQQHCLLVAAAPNPGEFHDACYLGAKANPARTGSETALRVSTYCLSSTTLLALAELISAEYQPVLESQYSITLRRPTSFQCISIPFPILEFCVFQHTVFKFPFQFQFCFTKPHQRNNHG